MYELTVAGLVALLLASVVHGDETYTTWGSVIYNRMGERTPEEFGSLTTVLTTVGSQQSYSAGQFFRNRYLTSQNARINGLNMNLIDSDQVYVLALDQQTSVASAQAFVQGLYPPVTINASAPTSLDPTSITSAQQYVEAPLGGYQYAQIHVSGALDADYIYLGGNIYCPAFDQSVLAAQQTSQYQSIRSASAGVFQALAPLLRNVVPTSAWSFDYAYPIYDYISYLAAHNSTAATLLQQPQFVDPATNKSYLYTLQWLADAQQQLQLGNMSAYNTIAKTTTLPQTGGSISTIAGNMLAAKMLSHLQFNIAKRGQQYKLSLLFGDFEPLVSLFTLMNLAHTSSKFAGLPEYASSAVFELYSRGDSSNTSFPSTDRLWVAFYFRNGTANNTDFYEYPAFNRGPSLTEMPWTDFQALMTYIALGSAGDWCTQCGATNLFCAAWNDSLTYTTATGIDASQSQLSPVVAGVVGAVVALAVATLLFALVMLLGRIRFHRRPRGSERKLRSFKGSAKLASDRDLTLPKSGVCATAEEDLSAAHERTGSWEMKEAGSGQDGLAYGRKASLDDELQVNPFSDPVKAHEQV